MSPILVVFGAIYHWYPKITGRMLNDTHGQVPLLGHVPRHLRDLLPDALPRASSACRAGITRWDNTVFIPESAQTLNEAITIAALIVGAVQVVFLYNLIWSYFNGKPSGGNPWRATTLEWQTPDTPPEARQLRPDAAGGLSLGLRLQRSGRRPRTSSRRISRRAGRPRVSKERSTPPTLVRRSLTLRAHRSRSGVTSMT